MVTKGTREKVPLGRLQVDNVRGTGKRNTVKTTGVYIYKKTGGGVERSFDN